MRLRHVVSALLVFLVIQTGGAHAGEPLEFPIGVYPFEKISFVTWNAFREQMPYIVMGDEEKGRRDGELVFRRPNGAVAGRVIADRALSEDRSARELKLAFYASDNGVLLKLEVQTQGQELKLPSFSKILRGELPYFLAPWPSDPKAPNREQASVLKIWLLNMYAGKLLLKRSFHQGEEHVKMEFWDNEGLRFLRYHEVKGRDFREFRYYLDSEKVMDHVGVLRARITRKEGELMGTEEYFWLGELVPVAKFQEMMEKTVVKLMLEDVQAGVMVGAQIFSAVTGMN